MNIFLRRHAAFIALVFVVSMGGLLGSCASGLDFNPATTDTADTTEQVTYTAPQDMPTYGQACPTQEPMRCENNNAIGCVKTRLDRYCNDYICTVTMHGGIPVAECVKPAAPVSPCGSKDYECAYVGCSSDFNFYCNGTCFEPANGRCSSSSVGNAPVTCSCAGKMCGELDSCGKNKCVGPTVSCPAANQVCSGTGNCDCPDIEIGVGQMLKGNCTSGCSTVAQGYSCQNGCLVKDKGCEVATCSYFTCFSVGCVNPGWRCDGKCATLDDSCKDNIPWVCGNGLCDVAGNETCKSCPSDCGACPATCGDGSCNGTESCSSCSKDCGACAPVCGDGSCNGTESCSSCSKDCGNCPSCPNGACSGQGCSSDPNWYCDGTCWQPANGTCYVTPNCKTGVFHHSYCSGCAYYDSYCADCSCATYTDVYRPEVTCSGC